MKIAVFTDCFFPGWGGTESATYNLCKGLIALGHRIVLFAPDYHREQTFTEFEVVRLKSIPFTENEMGVDLARKHKVLYEKINEFSPDIIYHCSALGMASLAIKVGKKLNKPIAATIHTKFKEAFYDASKSRLITHILLKSFVAKLNKTDKVVTVCDDMKNQLADYGYKGDVLVLRNGIDHIEHVSVEQQIEKDENCFTMLFCGRLVVMKNIQFSIKSLGLLKRNKGINNFKFILVGGGKYENKLRKLVKRWQLEENVVFYGYVSDKKELANIYHVSDLFLFPSLFDNDGLVICEAAMQGTPTLTVKGCGSSERIRDNENGFLSDHDAEKFSERIYEIMTNKSLYEHVCKNLEEPMGDTWLTVAKQYESLFQSLIKLHSISS